MKTIFFILTLLINVSIAQTLRPNEFIAEFGIEIGGNTRARTPIVTGNASKIIGNFQYNNMFNSHVGYAFNISNMCSPVPYIGNAYVGMHLLLRNKGVQSTIGLVRFLPLQTVDNYGLLTSIKTKTGKHTTFTVSYLIAGYNTTTIAFTIYSVDRAGKLFKHTKKYYDFNDYSYHVRN